MAYTGTASSAIAEWREFAGFAAPEQRYVKRSLDVGLARRDAVQRWARDPREAASIDRQYEVYQRLPALRADIPDGDGLSASAAFVGQLIGISGFDLGQGRLRSFAAYRFLYERLLGAEVRPWLPSAFCAAAALPQIRPQWRRDLLRSISEAAATCATWSVRQPGFFPEWIEPAAE